MTQLTLRGLDPKLEKHLRELAFRNSTSLNQAALLLMRRGAGLEPESRTREATTAWIARFAGRMPVAEARVVDRAIAESRRDDLALRR